MFLTGSIDSKLKADLIGQILMSVSLLGCAVMKTQGLRCVFFISWLIYKSKKASPIPPTPILGDLSRKWLYLS